MAAYGGVGGGVSAHQFPSIAEAAQAQNVEAVTDMLAKGCNLDRQDPDGNTALHWVAWFKLDTLLSKILERRARPDVGNSSGETAVHWAAKSSNINGLDTLTKSDRGLLSLRDFDGFTPFIISAQNDNAPVMEWMYMKGVSIEEQDDWGRTALQWACYKGHRKSVQWLLSRSASVVHRDNEGMTAIHWAALKGHEQASEMLLEVGAVHLLDAADAAGDTPIVLAMRKKNRYLVMCFHKCQLLQFLIGRPHISQNHFANLFVCFIALNIGVFAFCLAPGIANSHPGAVIFWSLLMALALVLWVQSCSADPGWLRPRTIFPQNHLIGDDPSSAFDVEQPVESQMAHYDGISHDWEDTGPNTQLARLELEQNKFNYQRQLITEARKKLEEGGPAANTGSTDLQPLIGDLTGETDQPLSQGRRMQLDRAAMALQERERAASERVGRARVEVLLAQGAGEYLTLVERGDFKQVCVVCRARKQMRSHHCKECGRCVDRLDHHCPWINNCVGLGNQRSFYCFIVTLLATIASFYYVVVLYTFDTVFPDLARGAFSELVGALIAILSSAFDLIWLAFVGALVVRHTAYMAVNITTYEVLVRPNHVQRRFPKNRGRFWFLHGFGVASSLLNCFNYWTLNTEQDATDFLGNVPAGGFIAGGGANALPEEVPASAGSRRGPEKGRTSPDPSSSQVAYHLLNAGVPQAAHPLRTGAAGTAPGRVPSGFER